MTERSERSSCAATRAFVEQMGLFLEEEGLPRIAGRIFGLVFLSDGVLSLDAMAHELGVSKASISTDARRLVQERLLERVSLSGDRRDYYRLAPDGITRVVALPIESVRRFKLAVDRLRQAELPSEVAERLDLYDRALQRILNVLTAALDELRGIVREFEGHRASLGINVT